MSFPISLIENKKVYLFFNQFFSVCIFVLGEGICCACEGQERLELGIVSDIQFLVLTLIT